MFKSDTQAVSVTYGNTLIIGASSQIGQALIAHVMAKHPLSPIVTVSRSSLALPDSVTQLLCDYSPQGIEQVGAALNALTGHIRRVVICHGILHTDTIKPEKRLEDLELNNMMEIFRVNALLPALWLKLLAPVLKGTQTCCVAVLSARVGSISDNRAGGWYSYRASKAALNMLLQCSAIEMARRAKNVKLIAFHPGTVDTPLSAPFQANVPAGKLFTPAFVAERLLGIVDEATPDGTASYLDYAGETIAW